MADSIPRRSFLRSATLGPLALTLNRGARARQSPAPRDFRLSLSARSLARSIREGRIDPLQFPVEARRSFHFEAVDYFTPLFPKSSPDDRLLAEMNKRAADHNIRQLLIAVAGEGSLGQADASRRARAVSNHRKWIDVAQALGCHGLCVKADGEGTADQQQQRLGDSLQRLLEDAARHKINVLVSNAAGLATRAQWLLELIAGLDSPLAGVQARFDGFAAEDPYAATAAVIPASRSVCAVATDFDRHGREIRIDFSRMMGVVLDGGYRGYVSVEYRGERLDEPAGIRAARALLERIRADGS